MTNFQERLAERFQHVLKGNVLPHVIRPRGRIVWNNRAVVIVLKRT